MSTDFVRRLCRSFPHATEHMQWESLVYKIGGKIFAIAALDPGGVWLSFKCSPEEFAELVERPGIIPAPYLARAFWVGLEAEDALGPAELKRRLRNAYDLIFAKLPRKKREEFAAGGDGPG